MKKILFILHFPPPVHGSAMVGGYIKDSISINSEFNTRYINLGTSKSIDAIGKKPFHKIIGYLKIIIRTIKQLVFFKPDIVYLAMTARGIGFYKDVVIAFMVKIFRVQLVVHFHNKGVCVNQHKKMDTILYQLVFKNTKVILLSKFLYPDVEKYVIEENVFYCANGIPKIMKDFSSEKVREIEFKSKIPQILFLSNLIDSKGVYVLLDALKLLKNRNIAFACNFVGGEGDISLLDFKSKVQELKLNKKVTYLGKKFGSDKVAIFKEADIFVHPSFSDCFPLVLLEASQFGLPMVSTFEGAIPEIIEDGVNGFLVAQKDVVALANKLEVLIKDKELRSKMGAAAYLKFSNNYTLEKFENNMATVLNKCFT